MRNNQTLRFTYLLGFILIAALLSGVFFLQTYEGITPCPLCLLQRMVMMALAIIFIIGALLKLNKWKSLFLNVLGLFINTCGILLASRQVWLQVSPLNGSGNCSVSLSYIFHVLSIKEALKQIWQGGMECSQTGWQFLHLSLAAWSLIGFVVLFLLVVLQLMRIIKN
jgi:disulfide bond formation protein DsbB